MTSSNKSRSTQRSPLSLLTIAYVGILSRQGHRSSEAGIKSVKQHLRRVLGNTTLTFKELYTTLVQIEACVNSRPITPLSTDPMDLEALTPGHFLVGSQLMALPEPDLLAFNEGRLRHWRLLQSFVLLEKMVLGIPHNTTTVVHMVQ